MLGHDDCVRDSPASAGFLIRGQKSEYRRGNSGSRRRKGSQLLEFTLVLLPMLAMVGVVLDMAWAVFVQGTLQWAVRYAAHQGSIMTASSLAQGACLTGTVKSLVQSNSVGLLNGTSGLALIKVNYLQPPTAGSSGASTDVSTTSTGDAPGNIMQVSVQNYSLVPLLPLFFTWAHAATTTPMTVNVYSADLIVSSGGNIPCIGTAP
jgi:Flp pilus assembly protein TadG